MSENESKDRARGRRDKRRRESEIVEEAAAPLAVVPTEPAPKRARRSAPRREPEPVVSDREAVLAANAVFYRSIEQRDITGIGETFAKVPHARCIHPGWEPLCGWEEIVGSFSQIFKNSGALRFELADIVVRVGGSLGWVELTENLEAIHEGKPARSQVLATNLFERQPDGRWLMIHHHASPVMVRHPSPKRGGEPLH